MKIYIAYGSNMNLEQMRNRCPESKFMGVGYLKGYELKFRGKGHANIIDAEGQKIPVVLWEITDRCEESLDIYEEYPDYYIKKNVMVNFDNELIEGMVYIMSKETENILKEPSEEYFDTILEGYKLNNIDYDGLFQALEDNKKENER